MRTLMQDIRYGMRMLLKNPGVTLLAVCALALGIGANAAIFSVADPLLLRPEPFPNLSRIALMYNKVGALTDENSMYPADYEAIRTQSRSFEQIAAHAGGNANLTGQGDPERVDSERVTPNFFDVLGVQPMLGRSFTAQEGVPGNDAEAILSYGLWQSKFAGDPQIVGKETQINGKSYTIVGVMGKDFNYPVGAELWQPLAFTAEDKTDHKNNYVFPVGLLKNGVSVSQAAAEMDALGKQLAKEFPQADAKMTIRAVPFRTYATDELTHDFMLLLLAAVGFVLLISCANVANLQLARVAGRERELAVRAALGASRWRIARQLLAESVLLAFLGGTLGVLLAIWATDALLHSIPQKLLNLSAVPIDLRVLAFAAGASFLSGILFGLLPSYAAAHSEIAVSLQEGGRGSSLNRRNRAIHGALVVTEIALALVLLAGSGLLIESFARLTHVNPGFDAGHLLTFKLSLPEKKYKDDAAQIAFYRELLDRIDHLPGVRSDSMEN
ncbi:MAG: ABC transporter permease, partial [Candidatus Acidiferrales bacterium]